MGNPCAGQRQRTHRICIPKCERVRETQPSDLNPAKWGKQGACVPMTDSSGRRAGELRERRAQALHRHRESSASSTGGEQLVHLRLQPAKLLPALSEPGLPARRPAKGRMSPPASSLGRASTGPQGAGKGQPGLGFSTRLWEGVQEGSRCSQDRPEATLWPSRCTEKGLAMVCGVCGRPTGRARARGLESPEPETAAQSAVQLDDSGC